MRRHLVTIALVASACTGHGEGPFEPGEDDPPPSPIPSIVVVPDEPSPPQRLDDDAGEVSPGPDLQGAREHFTRGVEAYERGEYEVALEHFVAAEAEYPSPQLRYNIAHTHEQLGETEAARTVYETLLDEPDLDPSTRQVVEGRLRDLDARSR